MSEPFLAEIRIVGFNFPMKYWAYCNGQILAIQQNTALFSLLGTTYGGNGTTTFGLPNFQGRMPMHSGQGPGLTPRYLGEMDGAETVTLLANEMPSHTHPMLGGDAVPVEQPAGSFPAASAARPYAIASPAGTAHPQTIQAAGAGFAHSNLQPFLALNFTIAMVGIFPARS